MAASLLKVVSRLIDLSVLPIEHLLRFLSQCCLSLLALCITLQQEARADAKYKRFVFENNLVNFIQLCNCWVCLGVCHIFLKLKFWSNRSY